MTEYYQKNAPAITLDRRCQSDDFFLSAVFAAITSGIRLAERKRGKTPFTEKVLKIYRRLSPKLPRKFLGGFKLINVFEYLVSVMLSCRMSEGGRMSFRN